MSDHILRNFATLVKYLNVQISASVMSTICIKYLDLYNISKKIPKLG